MIGHRRGRCYAPVLVKAPTELPVTLEQAKAHCRVDGTDEDGLIGSLIAAATGHLDGWNGILGRCLVTQTWRQDFDRLERELRLPMPAASIVSITYVDATGIESTFEVPTHALKAEELGSFVDVGCTVLPPPATNTRVGVTFIAGSAPDEVAAPIRQALLLLIGHWYANREAVAPTTLKELPMAVSSLLAPYRRVSL